MVVAGGGGTKRQECLGANSTCQILSRAAMSIASSICFPGMPSNVIIIMFWVLSLFQCVVLRVLMT